MTLRCKPGDLALVLVGKTNAGKLVTCLRLEQPAVFPTDCVDVWLVDRPLRWANVYGPFPKFDIPYAPDGALMPIRPEPDAIDTEISTDVPVKEGIS